jgi:membrane protein
MTRRIVRRIQRVVLAFIEDDAAQAAAAISFYAMTALSPLLVVVGSLAAVLVPRDVFEGYLLRQTDLVFGQVVTNFVATVLEHTQPGDFGWAAAAGFLFILLAAAALFAQLQTSLNKVWHIQPCHDGVWKPLVLDRLISMGVLLLTGALLVGSLFLSTWLSVAERWLSEQLQVTINVFAVTQNGLSFLLLTATCALLFRMLPETNIAWMDVISGASLTAALFLLTKSVFAFYLSRASITARYGQAGALVLLLLWIYFSSTIFLLGAEWTKVQAASRGRTIRARRRSERSLILGASHGFPKAKMVVRHPGSA